MRAFFTVLAMIFIAVSLTVFTAFTSHATEQLSYTVIDKKGPIEIRYYPAYLEATVMLPIQNGRVQGRPFNILAGYIFGNNIKKQKIAMTAPVISTIEPSKDKTDPSPESAEKIAMTAPVIRDFSAQGVYRMSFSMPKKYSMEDLPVPRDDRVILREVKAHYKAVYRYRGRASERQNQAGLQAITDFLAGNDGYQFLSGPMTAGYDSPWVPYNKRTNDVMVTIAVTAQD